MRKSAETSGDLPKSVHLGSERAQIWIQTIGLQDPSSWPSTVYLLPLCVSCVRLDLRSQETQPDKLTKGFVLTVAQAVNGGGRLAMSLPIPTLLLIPSPLVTYQCFQNVVSSNSWEVLKTLDGNGESSGSRGLEVFHICGTRVEFISPGLNMQLPHY